MNESKRQDLNELHASLNSCGGLRRDLTRQLRILVCSGNLGNAKPDEASFHAWIPQDGACHSAFNASHQEDGDTPLEVPYPVPNRKVKAYEIDDYPFLDVIVLGLQESTFFDANASRATLKTLTIDKNHLTKKKHSNNFAAEPKSAEMHPCHNPEEHFIPAAPPLKYKTSQGNTLLSNTLNTATAVAAKGTSKVLASNVGDGGTRELHAMLSARLPSYSHVVSYQRGEMRLEIFVRPPTTCQVLSVRAQNTGRAGLANKGGIVAQLLLNGNTRVTFLTAHLEAHEGASKYQARCSSLADIWAGTSSSLPNCGVFDAITTSHYTFCMGDLNFRTNLNIQDEEEHIAKAHQLAEEKDYDALNEADELQNALKKGHCLAGFQTLPCHFPPTFKVLREDGYVYKDNRSPSYTDRILWRCGHQLCDNLRPLLYEPIDHFTTSDHKPIRGIFDVELNHELRMKRTLPRRRRLGALGSHTEREVGQHDMHLFLEDMECDIYPKENREAPDPYLVFVSDPQEAVRVEMTGWQKFRNLFQRSSESFPFSNEDSKDRPSHCDFPTTKPISATLNPKWTDEIHFLVRMRHDDGQPINLTGSMLHFAVMDNTIKGDDKVIGVFSLNLANLILKSGTSNNSAARGLKSPLSQFTSMQQYTGSSLDMSDKLTFELEEDPPMEDTVNKDSSKNSSKDSSALRSMFRRSGEVEDIHDDEQKHDWTKGVRNLFGRARRNSSQVTCNSLDMIHSTDIDEPIYKNGMEMGRMRCSVDAWWLQDGQDPGVSGLFAMRKGLSSREVVKGKQGSLWKGINRLGRRKQSQQSSLQSRQARPRQEEMANGTHD